jgi:sugar lactone lactonase YvrE
MDLPYGVAVDSSGNMYIADSGNHRIRKVTGGVISTIAGTGSQGYSGDNGSAISAQLNIPYSTAVDSSGNVYIADSENHRIRKVTGGVISTIAGTGVAGSAYGDGDLARYAELNYPENVAVDSSGNVYIADINNHRIRKLYYA